jgi:energy-coupling factor transport system substrate-specific component
MRYRQITRTAILIAVCVVLGYLFLPVPNLEMISAGVFICGIWMGPRTGWLIGFLAEAIFSLSNPMGFPPPPLLAAQVLGMSLVGLTGGLLRRLLLDDGFFSRRGWPRHLLLGAAGLLLTIVFDLLTTISFPLTAGFSLQQIQVALAFGLPFTLIHQAANALIFALVVPLIINRLPAWRNP